MFVIGGLNMFFIGMYLEQVLPKTYGERKHPLFFVGCRFKTNKGMNSQVLHQSNDETENNFETKYLKEEYYEPVG
jgi:hypothetical protein